MSDLDENLASILAQVRGWKHDDGVKSIGIYDEALPAIKQAFIDAGWNEPFDAEGVINCGTDENPVLIHKDSLPFSPHSGGGYIDIPKDLRMTDQEWYKRYMDMFDRVKITGEVGGPAYCSPSDVIAAAKKASVLEEE